MNFELYLAHGQAFIREVAQELQAPGDLRSAGRVTRAVLHTLRDRLTPQEAVDLAAQLPVLLKGIFFDGWRLARSPDKTIRSVEDFVDVMRLEDQRDEIDFPSDVVAVMAAQAVFRVLKRHVSAGEVDDVTGQLPKRLKHLWADA